MAYARGKNAYGICDISGFRYKLNTMKRTWDGLLVGPDMYDPKHPQLEPKRNVSDPEALLNARPDVKSTIHLGTVLIKNPVNSEGVSSPIMYALNTNTIGSSFTGQQATAELGGVSVTT